MLGLVAMMMDYMLPKKVMSWKEAWEIYFVEAGGSLFEDLARYGLKMPKYADVATEAAEHISHQNWAILYQYTHAAAFHTWMPDAEHLDWLSEKYPEHLRQILSAALGNVGAGGEGRQPLLQHGAAAALPDLPDPDGLHRAGRSRPRSASARSQFKGETYHFCSDGCKDIFDDEPEKLSRPGCRFTKSSRAIAAARPYRTCSNWYKINVGADNMDYVGSPDEKLWNQWRAKADVSRLVSRHFNGRRAARTPPPLIKSEKTMAVTAITPDYENNTEYRDCREKFHGNRMVYVHWEQHLSFCAALAFPLPPDAVRRLHRGDRSSRITTASRLRQRSIGIGRLDDRRRQSPAGLSKSIAENSIGHKSLIRFWTPGLAGCKGTAS